MEEATSLPKALLNNTNNPKLAWHLFKRILSSSHLSLRSLTIIARILISAKMHPEIDALHHLLLHSQPPNPPPLPRFPRANLRQDMIVSGVKPETYTFNLLICALCDCGRLEDARQVFDKMRDKGCQPNEYSVGIFGSRVLQSWA
ncbi:hypothetical protein J5N97_000540 [Dioscorea zingiberensis]|uniref:Pentatricopeptide repeat-containing protein n=1 Tax=Dioscorea zingiberensis TaxID=325984 RepID=A0A9D5BS61_9LILI|nr:hypothetical protein J5N97_000540 [Dioscorea zingiberensis]